MWSFISVLCLITSVVIMFCFVIYYLIFWRKTEQWKQRNIPFLPPVFPIGNKYILSMYKNVITIALDRIYRENEDKDLVAFFMTVLPVILVRDPKLIKQIFAKNADKNFSTFYILPKDEIATQSMPIFASDQIQWKIGRSVLDPAVAPWRMGGQTFEKFNTQIKRLWHHLEETRLTGNPIFVKKFTDIFFYDGWLHWNFSEKVNSYEEKPKVHIVLGEFFENSLIRMVIFFAQVCWPSLLQFGAKFFKSLQIVEQKYFDFMRKFLEKKIKYRMENKEKFNDFVDDLVALRQDSMAEFLHENKETIPKDKAEMNLRQLTGYALTMAFAADNVSELCLYAVHLLSLHPEYQCRIKTEIDDVMKKHETAEITFEVIQDLRFTEQCILESSRLIPLTFMIMRRCSEDFQIPGTNYQFKKGDIFIAVPYAVQRDPKYFKNPDKFDPERFNSENKESSVMDKFITFGLGPRKCPGYNIAVLQAVMFVASLLFKYEIRPRSHLQPMTAADFDPRAVVHLPKQELLIHLIPRHTFTD